MYGIRLTVLTELLRHEMDGGVTKLIGLTVWKSVDARERVRYGTVVVRSHRGTEFA